MTSTNEGEGGGQAFPRSCGQCGSDVDGMTLRDYFAAAALTGLISGGGLFHSDHEDRAYEIADAMLKQKALSTPKDRP